MAPGGRDIHNYSLGDLMSEKEKNLHEKVNSISARLGEDLREDYDFRSIPIREGDTVEVKRGDFKGLEGEIISVDTDSQQIIVDGVDVATADETEVPSPIHPSNVEVIDLEDDNMRDKIIERRSKDGEERRKESSEED